MASVRRSYPRSSATATRAGPGIAYSENAGRQIKVLPTGEIIKELDGALMCSCRGYATSKHGFCEHLELSIREGYDAVPTGNPHGDFAALPEHMEVPVFPKVLPPLIVTLGHVENDGSRPVAADECGEQPIHLGWLWPGEGRLVIRSLFLEWLKSQYHHVPNCTSRVHTGLRWTVTDSRDAEPRGDLLADIWNLLMTGICSQCQQFQTFDEDAPAL